MLDELKQAYANHADITVPGWRDMPKNDLCRTHTAVSSDKVKQEGYFSAIAVTYWGKLNKYKQISPGFDSLDFYDWFIRGLRIALERHPWTDPESAIYNDPNGPDKVINRALKTSRLSSYEKSNTYKRKANMNSASIEALEEAFKDSVVPDSLQVFLNEEEDLPHLIMKDSFKKKDYFTVFMVFNIIARDPFETVIDERGKSKLLLSEKKLVRYMHGIDDRLCKVLAKEIDVDLEETRFAAKTCTELSLNRIRKAIRRNLKILANSDYFSKE